MEKWLVRYRRQKEDTERNVISNVIANIIDSLYEDKNIVLETIVICSCFIPVLQIAELLCNARSALYLPSLTD